MTELVKKVEKERNLRIKYGNETPTSQRKKENF